MNSRGIQRRGVAGPSRQLVTVTNDSYANAHSMVALLKQLANQFTDAAITLVMDNARHQRCKFVMDHAHELGIELLFLPPYSPQLDRAAVEIRQEKMSLLSLL